MKLLGYVLMTVFLVLGALAATTAYAPPTDLGDDDLVGLTLNAPAGIARAPDASLVTRARARPAIAAKAIGALRDAKRGRARIVYTTAIGGSRPAAAASGEGRITLADRAGAGALGAAPVADHDLHLFVEGLTKGQTADIAAEIDAAAGTAEGHHVVVGLGAGIDLLHDAGNALAFVSAISLQDVDKLARDADGRLTAAGAPLALANARHVLSPALLAALRAGGEQRVRVKEFSFGRWSLFWLMALAIPGLFAGSMLVRTATKADIAEQAERSTGGEASPEAAMRGIRAAADGLHGRLADAAPGARLEPILEVLGHVQQTQVQAVVDARPALIGTLGLGGFAEFMDRFSQLERQINRAWSAAADGNDVEATACLERIPALVAAAEEKLGRG